MGCSRDDSSIGRAMNYHNYTDLQKSDIELKIEQDSFKDWYGKGERDVFTYPVVRDFLYIENEKGDKTTLHELLNGDFANKRDKYSADLNWLDKLKIFLEDNRLTTARRIEAYDDTDYAKRLQRTLDSLKQLSEDEYVKELATYTQEIIKELATLEARFYKRDSLKNDAERKADEKSYKNFLLQANNFLSTFSKIETLELPADKSSDVYKLIEKLRSAETQVTDLKNRVNAEIEASVRDVLDEVISNPEVREGIKDFLAAQTDESALQYRLDALGDSHITFIAAIDKFFKRAMYDKEKEKKETIKEWKELVAKIEKEYGSFNNWLDKVVEKKDGERTGRFVQEWDEKYYEELFNEKAKVDAIKDKKSPEHAEALEKYFKWRRENTQQKYTDEYYNLLDKLHPAARQAKEDIDTLRDDIYAHGKGKLTPENFEQLDELNRKMRALKSTVNEDGTDKTGVDLEIANSLTQYSKEMAEVYESEGVDMKSFLRAKQIAEQKGELEKFEEYNTREEFSPEFWEEFEEMMENMPSNDEIKALRKEIKEILVRYKNKDNEVEGDRLSAGLRTRIGAIQEQINEIKAELAETDDAEDKLRRKEEFQRLVKFVNTKEYERVLADKKKKVADGVITQDEFNQWFFQNHDPNPYSEHWTPIDMWRKMVPRDPRHISKVPTHVWHVTKIKDKYLNPAYWEVDSTGKKKPKLDHNGFAFPTDKWKNKEFNSLSDKDKEYLKEVTDLLLYLTEHSNKGNIVRRGYLPAIPKDTRNNWEFATGQPINKKDKVDNSNRTITESAELVKKIPFKYVSLITIAGESEELLPITEGMSEEEVKKTKEENEKIRARNRQVHGKAVDYNLKDTMETFIGVALTNKYKSEIETDIKLFSQQMKHQKVKKTDAKGNEILDRIKGAVTGKKEEYEVSATGSNMEKHFAEWLDGVFYENWELDEGALTDITRKLINFSSLRALGLNVLSGLNNAIIGNLQARIESAGDIYFSYKDYRKAKVGYYQSIHHFVANRNETVSENKHDAFTKYFDILVSQDELASKPDGTFKTYLHKLAMLKSAAYFMQHLGEHQIQNTALFAMAHSHRVVDGKIVNFTEFWEGKKQKIEYKANMSAEEKGEVYKAIEENKKLRIEMEEKFKNYPTLFESFEIKDKQLVPKEGITFAKDEIFNFRERVIGINQRLHGIYNTEDAATIQRTAIGRLAMQFRKWIRPSWNRRFGRKFGETNWNERVRDYDQGMYIAMAKFIGSPFKESYKQYRKKEEAVAMAAFKSILDGFNELIFNSKIRWHSMTEVEKANVKKTALEMLFLISVTVLGYVIMNMKGDDDDKFLTWALYQADRLFGELSTFTPFGIVREGNRLFKSPSPVFNTLEDVSRLGLTLIAYPFGDEESNTFKSGIYHGEDKLGIYAQDMVPFWTQIQKIKYLNDNTRRYGMFR